MLDGVNDYLPSPLDVKPYKATDPETGEEIELKADDSAPFAGLAFKIAYRPIRRSFNILPCLPWYS